MLSREHTGPAILLPRTRKKYVRRAAAAVAHGLAVIALVSAVPAQAATVDYTTTATFSCVGCVITSNGSEDVKVVYGTGSNTATLQFFGAPSGTSVISDEISFRPP